jgi:hypothetical protein
MLRSNEYDIKVISKLPPRKKEKQNTQVNSQNH